MSARYFIAFAKTCFFLNSLSSIMERIGERSTIKRLISLCAVTTILLAFGMCVGIQALSKTPVQCLVASTCIQLCPD